MCDYDLSGASIFTNFLTSQLETVAKVYSLGLSRDILYGGNPKLFGGDFSFSTETANKTSEE